MAPVSVYCTSNDIHYTICTFVSKALDYYYSLLFKQYFILLVG